MKTAHHTFTTWSSSAMAAGFDSAAGGLHQTAVVQEPEQIRAAGGDNVIDLTAWRTANMEKFWEEGDGFGCEGGGAAWEAEPLDGPAVPAPRPRKSRRAMFTAELVSTLSVVAAAAALIVRVLTF